MRGMPSRRVVVLMLLLDVAISLAAYLVAFRLRFLLGPLPLYNLLPFLRVLPAIVVLSLLTHALFGVFQLHLDVEEAQANVISASFGNLVASMALTYVVGVFSVPRSVLLLGAVLQGVGLALAVRRLPGLTRQGPLPLHDLGALDEAEFLQDIATREVEVVPDVPSVLLVGAHLSRGEDYQFRLLLPSIGLTPGERTVKRAFDLACLLVVAAPAIVVMGTVALLVLVTSGRPVLYSQERVGRYGKTFRLWKFRTMVPDAEAGTGPTLALPEDQRITWAGRILRPLRLDELPQLWNVLVGDMSLVGPRPERPEFSAEYLERVPHYRLRLGVKPGLTGFAQLYGSYDLSVEEKLKYDLYYLHHYSPALDFLLLLRTIAVPLQPKKARSRETVESEQGVQLPTGHHGDASTLHPGGPMS